MEDSMVYQNCEMLGRFLEGNASYSEKTAIRYGISTPLCELVMVSLKAMNLISKEQR